LSLPSLNEYADDLSQAASTKRSTGIFEEKASEVAKHAIESQIWDWKNRADKIKEIHDNAESIIHDAKASNKRGFRKVSVKVKKIFAKVSAIQSVVVETNRALNQLAIDHPELKNALLCYTAKELVSKSDTAVRKNQKLVFAFAYIAFMQAQENKMFVKFFLGYLAVRCRFVIPVLLIRKDFASEDDWYTTLGFLEKPDVSREVGFENNFSCGETKVFEPVLSWLNRVRCCMLLYGAFIQINPYQGSHPHDIFYAWRWLARVLNSPPDLGTATALHSFLTVVSYQMMKAYPTQFKKLLAFVSNDYLARLPQYSNEMQFGFNKLENLLEEFNTIGIKKPMGAVFDNKVTSGTVD